MERKFEIHHPMRHFLILPVLAAVLLSAAPASAGTLGDFLRTYFSLPYVADYDTRAAFPDEFAVRSWGDPASKEVSVDVLAEKPLSGVLPIRQGSALVKFGTDPKVYAVGPGGTLHWLTRPSVAADLYGPAWPERVATLLTSFYANYRVGDPIEESRYPEGSLLKYPDRSTVYYLQEGRLRPFMSEEAFLANHFRFESVVTVSEDLGYGPGDPIAGYEGTLHPFVI
jgi:hypothetical protein